MQYIPYITACRSYLLTDSHECCRLGQMDLQVGLPRIQSTHTGNQKGINTGPVSFCRSHRRSCWVHIADPGLFRQQGSPTVSGRLCRSITQSDRPQWETVQSTSRDTIEETALNAMCGTPGGPLRSEGLTADPAPSIQAHLSPSRQHLSLASFRRRVIDRSPFPVFFPFLSHRIESQ